jgi:hypothetical protein
MELLRQVLDEVRQGKKHFCPENESLEAIETFQKIGERLKFSETKGYLSVRFRVSRSRSNYGNILDAFITSGLTFEGEQFLAKLELPEEDSRRNKIIEMKPSLYGFSIDLPEAFRWLKSKWKK